MNGERINIRNQRRIVERIIIKGTLILDTPTCLGSGDSDSYTDLEVLRDSIEDKALLMGSSTAGALRNYFREYKNGYYGVEESILFGGKRSEDDGEQSPLIVYDALSSDVIKAELRDGVKINSITRTAESGAKYDLEFLEAGTQFHLCFELLIDENSNRAQLLQELVICLEGLKQGVIRLGIKKNRGFGRCHVEKWQVWKFDLRKPDERIQWLTFHHWETVFPDETYDNIADALNISLNLEDKTNCIAITAKFNLVSSLLIRSGQASTDKAPDVVHLKSRRNGELKSILSGTSLAGVLRHRAEKIINTLDITNTLQKNTSNSERIIDKMFGVDIANNKTKKAKASRLIVDEVEIKETTDLVQNRIAIDRFTGGALHGALFAEQPIFGNDEAEEHLEIRLELRQPEDYEIGLLLLLLKDLWTGDLPVGGTSSIGRGRLQGKKASIKFGKDTWTISQKSKNEPLIVKNAQDLEKFVVALHKELTA